MGGWVGGNHDWFCVFCIVYKEEKGGEEEEEEEEDEAERKGVESSCIEAAHHPTKESKTVETRAASPIQLHPPTHPSANSSCVVFSSFGCLL